MWKLLLIFPQFSRRVLQKEGASHITHMSSEFLIRKLPNHWYGRVNYWFVKEYPLISYLSIFVCSHIRNVVYHRKLETLQDLNNFIEEVTSSRIPEIFQWFFKIFMKACKIALTMMNHLFKNINFTYCFICWKNFIYILFWFSSILGFKYDS